MTSYMKSIWLSYGVGKICTDLWDLIRSVQISQISTLYKSEQCTEAICSCFRSKWFQPTILVTNLETLVRFSPSSMLIWVLQSSHCSKIHVAQHWRRRGPNLSENKGVRSECKKFGENSREMVPVSTICDEYCRLIPFFSFFVSKP